MTDVRVDRQVSEGDMAHPAEQNRAGRYRTRNRLSPRRRSLGLAVSYVVLSFGALLVVGPFVWEALTTLKGLGESLRVPPTFIPTHPKWSNYADVFDHVPFGRQFLNTVIVSFARTAGQLFFCSLAAYAFARLVFPFKRTLFAVFLGVLMVPYQLFVIPQYRIMADLGWLNTLQALILPGLFSAFGTFLLRQFFMTLPRELDEAAELDGCNPFQRYFHIALPLAKPGLIALGVLTFLASWNDLFWPLIVNTDPEQMTLAAGLASLKDQYISNYPVIMAGTLMASLPTILVFAVMQKHFIQGIASTGISK